MAWRRPGAEPLSEPMMVSLLTRICVTRPQWVNVCIDCLQFYKGVNKVKSATLWVFLHECGMYLNCTNVDEYVSKLQKPRRGFSHLPWPEGTPDGKVHGSNMGPIWGRLDPGGPHVGPMNFAIWDTVAATGDIWQCLKPGHTSQTVWFTCKVPFCRVASRGRYGHLKHGRMAMTWVPFLNGITVICASCYWGFLSSLFRVLPLRDMPQQFSLSNLKKWLHFGIDRQFRNTFHKRHHTAGHAISDYSASPLLKPFT